MRALLLTSMAALATGRLLAQCSAGETQVTVSIVTDAYGSETTWELTGPGGSPVYASGGPYNDVSGGNGTTTQPSVNACIPDGSVIVFTVEDEYGDGMNGGYGEGHWTVSAGGVDLATGGSFGASETASLAIGATDLGLNSVEVGYKYITPGSYTVSGRVSNYSTLPIEGFTLTYTVDGADAVSEDFSATVPVGGSYDYTFATPWNAPLGQHHVDVSVTSVTGGDLISNNNNGTRPEHVVEQVVDRTTLVEEFTSSTCIPCANFNQYFDPTLEDLNTNVSGSNVAAVKYQMNWPAPGNDPSYNPDGNSRKSYYGVTGIPFPFIDGKAMVYGNEAEIEAARDEPSPVAVEVSCTYMGTDIYVEAHVTPLASSLTGTYKLHLAVTEDHYSYPASTTTQDEFHFAMRKMLPNAQGTTLEPFVMGQEQVITQGYSLIEGGPAQGNYHLWGTVAGTTVVAFVQKNDKEIMQSAFAESVVGIDELQNDDLLGVYPNPTTGLVYMNYGKTANAQVDVVNVLGENLLRINRNFNAGHLNTLDLSALENGVYFVNITADGVRSTRRVVLNR